MGCCYRRVCQRNKHGNKQILNAITFWLHIYGGLRKLWLNNLPDPWPGKACKCIKGRSAWLSGGTAKQQQQHQKRVHC